MGQLGHTVTIGAFLLDTTEVSVAAYAECVKVGKCSTEGITSFFTCNSGTAERANHPMNCVDLGQATAYCDFAGKRLPTEYEWEWAARGADRGTTHPWGNDPPARQLCWNGEDNELGRRPGTCPIGSFPEGDSPHRIKDLAGNVWEWTSSAYDGSSTVVRGGSWADGGAGRFAASFREPFPPTTRYANLGFRCAKTP
jgi:formylglycine-generating enzyme required for sulfatase activity